MHRPCGFLESEARAAAARGQVDDAWAAVERSLIIAPAAGWGETSGDLMTEVAAGLCAQLPDVLRFKGSMEQAAARVGNHAALWRYRPGSHS